MKFFQEAKALKFDRNDHLHERYLKQFFAEEIDFPYQIIPSVAGFKKYALLGYGYGLIPRIDIEEELKEGTLINLFAANSREVPLYWHLGQIKSEYYQNINHQIILCAQKRLREGGA